MDVIEIPPIQEDPGDDDEENELSQEPSLPYASVTPRTAELTQSTTQQPIRRSARAPASTAHPERRLSAANLMEKLKMTFFEKRKSSAIMSRNEQQRGRKRSNKPRPLSYPNFLIRPFSRDDDDDDSNGYHNDNNAPVQQQSQAIPSSSSVSPSPLASPQSALSFNSLSRQSTTHLSEIQEETDSIRCQQPSTHHHHQRQQQPQPMAIDT